MIDESTEVVAMEREATKASHTKHPANNYQSLLNVFIVKVSKVFKQSVARCLDHTTLGSREKHLNLLSHGSVLFLINPGTTIGYRAPPNPPTQPC